MSENRNNTVAEQKEIDEFLANYPEYAWMWHDPVLKKVIEKYLVEVTHYGDNQEAKIGLLQRLLLETEYDDGENFFSKFSDTNQKYLADGNDPTRVATFKQNMMDRYYDVIRMAQQKGIIITQENASNLAHMSYRHGWDGEEMKKQVGHVLTNYEKQKYYDNESKRWDYDWDTKVFVGEVGDWMDYGRDRAAKQLIEVDQDVLYNYALMAVDGVKSKSDIDRWIDNLTKGAWGSYSEQIDTWPEDTGGEYTITDYLAGAKSAIGNTLEIEERDISWTDPKYAQVVFHKDEEGNHKFMDKYEAQEWAQRQGGGWEKTSNYRKKMASKANVIQKAFTGRQL